jgi:hypothetical protein
MRKVSCLGVSGAGLVCVCLLAAPCGGIAQQADAVAQNDLSAKFHIDEQDPESSVPTAEQALRSPLEMGYLLMDLIARAEAATQRGDHAAAVRYNRAIVKASPQRALAHANLCKAYEAVGDQPHALESCKASLGLGGVTADDYAHYARLVLAQPGELPKSELEDVEAIIAHLQEQMSGTAQGKTLPAALSCEVATRLNDNARLERCTNELAAAAPGDPRTITFQWALALARHDDDAARAVIERARQAGLPAAAIAEMQAKLSRENAPAPFGALREFGPLGLIALLSGLGFLIVRKRSPAHA